MEQATGARRAEACVVFNPRAGSAERIEELRELILRDPRVDLCPTGAAGEATSIAATAVRERRRVVAAAGGDGTVSEVVRGLMEAREASPGVELPPLLIVPMGTGNDLVRTLGLPGDVEGALALLEHGQVVPLDVLRWHLEPADPAAEQSSGWCVNVVNGGFAARLKEMLTPEIKKAWGPLAYARAALGSTDELRSHALEFSVDGGRPQRTEAINVIVANARFAGGGIEVAPHADPADGRLDVIVIQPGDWLDIARVATSLLTGDIDQDQHTLRLSARSVELRSSPPMPFNIDGDPVGEGTLRVEVVPGALRVIVPPAQNEE